jgi:hypothetical protein
MSEEQKHPMMACGCQANGQDKNGNPVCCVHIGIAEGARVVQEAPPNLAGRQAKCGDCGRTEASEQALSGRLAFFRHQPTKPFDYFYCGCYGWN